MIEAKHPRLLFVDLDGTLNTSSDKRAQYVPKGAAVNHCDAWLTWHLRHTVEAAVLPRVAFVNTLASEGWTVILISMRDIRAKSTTVEQLKEWKLKYAYLALTSPGDHRSPERMKCDVVRDMVAAIEVSTGLVPKVLFMDDDEDTCQEMRNIGVSVLQVIKAKHADQC